MPKDIFILLIKAVGRYLVIVFNVNKAQRTIITQLKKYCDDVEINNSTLSFGVDVHQDPLEIAQQIFEIHSNA